MEEDADRFRVDLERLTGAAPTSTRPLGLAVSGGADSLALLLLAHRAYPGAIAAATVDHELRPEAAAEARGVAALCAERAIPHETLRRERRLRVEAGNLQDRARLIRYQCLERWATRLAIGHVAVAHHRDDLAETFVMRANRGAGVRGLAAMRTARTLNFSTIMLVRPLLSWRREHLAMFVAREGLVPVHDPSNADPRFDRARVRAMLAGEAELKPDQLARAAEHLRDVEEAIEWWVLGELKARFELDEDGDGWWLRADDLPFELKRRFVLRAIQSVREEDFMFDAWRTTGVAGLVRALDAGTGGVVADVQARVRKGRWHFRPAPPRAPRR